VKSTPHVSDLDLWAKEKAYRCVIGVDEAGRGPWAGAVVVAAVVLGETNIRFYDSKQISEKNREKLFENVLTESRAYSIQRSSAARIDEINILRATLEAMKTAVLEVIKKLPEVDCVIVDGNQIIPGLPVPCVAFPKADSRAQCVAAASILAKVSRDREMIALDSQYPQYQFSKHKGYGTALHLQLLQQHGACPEHRKSFAPVKEVLGLTSLKDSLFLATNEKTK
jgi:ribonuclease HII